MSVAAMRVPADSTANSSPTCPVLRGPSPPPRPRSPLPELSYAAVAVVGRVGEAVLETSSLNWARQLEYLGERCDTRVPLVSTLPSTYLQGQVALRDEVARPWCGRRLATAGKGGFVRRLLEIAA